MERNGWPRRPVFLCHLHGIVDWVGVCVTWPHFALVTLRFGPALTICHGPIYTQLTSINSCGPTLSGSCWGSWQWDGPSPCRCPQARVSLRPPRCYPSCSCHLLPHGVFDPHPSWFLSLIWGRDSCSLHVPLATGCHCWTTEILKRLPQTWTRHSYVFKKCFTWKYLIACSTKISFPKPQGLEVWLHEGCLVKFVFVPGWGSTGLQIFTRRPLFGHNLKKD